MKKITKGHKGYIEYNKRFTFIRSLICIGIVVGLFLIGLIRFKTNQNGLSIVAALGCLPTGWSVVNFIMYFRGKKISEDAFERIETCKGSLLVNYELEMTSERATFHVAALTVLEKNVIGFTQDDDMDISDCEKHIELLLNQNKHKDYTIKIFTKLDDFCERLKQLEKLREDHKINPKEIEANWKPGTIQTPMGVLMSASL